MKDIGQILGQGWEVTKVLGNGSFGQVLEIQRDYFGTPEKAALKVISIPKNRENIDELYGESFTQDAVTSRFQSQRDDIIREYSLMKLIKGHTNVVYCDDLICEPKEDGIGWDIYIKMELLTPLLKWKDENLTPLEVARLGWDMCSALAVCHNNDIIHRDVKPQNIFLSDSGDFKLGDFGIAKVSAEVSGGTKIGTYKFMAPEVYNGKPYGKSVDIYALGLVMYWLLNERRVPFLPLPPQGYTALKEEEALRRRCSGEKLPPPLNGSKELKAIVMKACAFDPKDRYSSAEEMREALERMEMPKKTLPVKKIAVAAAALGLAAAIGLFAFAGKKTGDNGPAGKDDRADVFEAPGITVSEGGNVSGYTFHVEPCSWTEANDSAVKKGGHLVHINSMEEFDHLVAEIERLGLKDKYFFIGSRRDEKSEDYYWVGGDSLKTDSDGEHPLNNEESPLFGLWLEGEPSYGYDDKEEHYVEMHADPEGRWGLNDAKNEILSYSPKSVAYIVEYDGGGSDCLNIAWNEVADADFYELYRSTDPAGEFEKVGIYASDTLSYTDTDLQAGVAHYYKVRACRGTDSGRVYSDYSEVKSGVCMSAQSMQFGWRETDGKLFYVGEDGTMQTGWQDIGGARYCFAKDGAMLTGWQDLNKDRYYLGADGVAAVGWQEISGKYYFFDSNGAMQTKWMKTGDYSYYLGDDGAMRTEWQEIDGKYYYFREDGIMATQWLQMGNYYYYLGDDGAMRTGWQEINGKRYYIREDGIMYTHWVELEEGYYYFGDDGAMRTGEHEIDGKTYYFNENGILVE